MRIGTDEGGASGRSLQLRVTGAGYDPVLERELVPGEVLELEAQHALKLIHQHRATAIARKPWERAETRAGR